MQADLHHLYVLGSRQTGTNSLGWFHEHDAE
jgi:hypothetical protein